MDVYGLTIDDADAATRLSSSAQARQVKQKKKADRHKAVAATTSVVQPVTVDEEAEKELEFMAFLNQVGGKCRRHGRLPCQETFRLTLL
jgi:hypothetical protein